MYLLIRGSDENMCLIREGDHGRARIMHAVDQLPIVLMAEPLKFSGSK